MNDLGILYKEGDGVPRDTKTARQWFEKAAALGNPEAKQNLRGMRK
jgi:TPR repeat protein